MYDNNSAAPRETVHSFSPMSAACAAASAAAFSSWRWIHIGFSNARRVPARVP